LRRSRSVRAAALALTAVLALTVLGACGGSNGDQADVAKQDRAIEQGNKAAAQYEQAIRAALRKKWQTRARERARQARARTAARGGQTQAILGRGSITDPNGTGDICGPIRKRFPGRAGRADRQARRQRRMQSLSYLNLSCPR
jgi:hypothetical protein